MHAVVLQGGFPNLCNASIKRKAKTRSFSLKSATCDHVFCFADVLQRFGNPHYKTRMEAGNEVKQNEITIHSKQG